MKEYVDILKGGLADRYLPQDFDPIQLKIGIKHELEHTNSLQIAREVAMDHLSEDPDYYKKLNKIEEIRLFVRSIVLEHWDQHLHVVMNPGEDYPWDNDEDGPSTNKDPRNPANIYKQANDSLNKVKANAHPKSYPRQKAGVHRGSGTPGGSRNPGGNRQSAAGGF